MKRFIESLSALFRSEKPASCLNIFEVARKGTLEEMIQIHREHPDRIDSVDRKGCSPLVLACYHGNHEVAIYLTTVVSDINATSPLGTALMACLYKKNDTLAAFLLQYGSNPNIQDTNGNTALAAATQFRNYGFVKLLLEYKADKALRDGLGKTAFEYAAFTEDRQVMDLLKN